MPQYFKELEEYINEIEGSGRNGSREWFRSVMGYVYHNYLDKLRSP